MSNRNEVVRLRGEGLRNKEIAKLLGIEVHKVQSCVSNARAAGIKVRTCSIGKAKKLSAEQSAVIFEAQVQIAAAKKLIERVLIEAGVKRHGFTRMLTFNWRARGRVDVMEKQLPRLQPQGAVL